MKIHGYSNENLHIDHLNFLKLAEITLMASPLELRRIATFLNHCADNMDNMGKAYSHEHLSDQQADFQDSPHLVVFNTLNEQ